MTSNSSFREALEYIALKEDSELQKEACQGIFLKGSKEEFIKKASKLMHKTSKRSQRTEKPVKHISINPHPEDWEKVENKIPELVQDFTKALGTERCQRVAALHTDTEAPGYGTRPHIHVIYNSVPYKGDSEAIDASKNWMRNREMTLDQLTEKYGLKHKPTIPDRRKDTNGLTLTSRQQQQEYERGLRESPPQPTLIQSTQDLIEDAVNKNDTLTDFLNYLQQQNCHTRITTRDNEILGISYENEGVTFKGSYLGRGSMASTLKGLTNRGISINLDKDTEAIAQRAIDKNNPQRKISVEDIKSDSKNSKFNSKPEFNEPTLKDKHSKKQLQL